MAGLGVRPRVEERRGQRRTHDPGVPQVALIGPGSCGTGGSADGSPAGGVGSGGGSPMAGNEPSLGRGVSDCIVGLMPGMGGIALAGGLRRRFPGLPVLLASGYSHVLAQDGAEDFEFLNKPYSAEQLARILRRLTTKRAAGLVG